MPAHPVEIAPDEVGKVLEDVMVYGAQMGRVKKARNWRCFELFNPGKGDNTLSPGR